MNALELYEGLNEGKKYNKGGGVESENKEMVLNNNKQIAHHTKELQSAIKGKNVPAWVVAKVNRSASDLSDATHYMEGQGESYADGGGVGDVNQVKIEITEQYNDERGNKKNTTKSYDVNYLVNFPNKEFIELTGTLKPYHTGRDYDYKFEVDYFADQEEENYYDENSEKIENEILNKFYNKKETGGGVGDKWQIKDSKDKYFSVSMQTGKPVWNESPDLGYSYEKQEAEKIKDKLVQLGNKNLEVVEYNPNWWKMKTGGGVNITESDIIEGVSFKNKSGTTFIIDKIELDPKFGKLVSSSLLGGKKGNYRDGITDFIAFLNEGKAVKYKSGGKLAGWKHRKK
jgi:hypothetical protein